VRILALEVEKQEISADDNHAILTEEARMVWKLYQGDFIRELYFRADRPSAILVLECTDIKEAKQQLSELPLVSANLIDFELIPLAPYPGFSRLFEA
jgi:hypothetical protein